MLRACIALFAVAVAGCASVDGDTLRPGTSTQRDVTALMGAPSVEVKRPDGDTWLYYPHHPWGRITYVAALDPKGVLRGVEQRLTYDNIHSIRDGMRIEDVELLLGPPRKIGYMPRKPWKIAEFPWWFANREMRVLFVYYTADDGVVRRVDEMHDYTDQPENSRN
ncbi:MAG TPA: hypothetical protein VFV84_12115 [Burkholderiales bacterium]|nr:hypothetical protein [Burkholderiales bacterium]